MVEHAEPMVRVILFPHSTSVTKCPFRPLMMPVWASQGEYWEAMRLLRSSCAADSRFYLSTPSVSPEMTFREMSTYAMRIGRVAMISAANRAVQSLFGRWKHDAPEHAELRTPVDRGGVLEFGWQGTA